MKKLSHPQLVQIAKVASVITVVLGILLPYLPENDLLYILTILIIVACGVFVSLVINQNFFAEKSRGNVST